MVRKEERRMKGEGERERCWEKRLGWEKVVWRVVWVWELRGSGIERVKCRWVSVVYVIFCVLGFFFMSDCCGWCCWEWEIRLSRRWGGVWLLSRVWVFFFCGFGCWFFFILILWSVCDVFFCEGCGVGIWFLVFYIFIFVIVIGRMV